MSHLPTPFLRAAALLLLATLAAPSAPANEGSREFVRQGRAALAAGDTATALDAFDLAMRVDADDAEAVFFFGVAHNRAGNPAEALTALNRALGRGYVHPRLDLERAYALVNLGRDAAARALLEPWAAAHPDAGIARQLLARLALRAGDTTRARALAADAARLDPQLTATAGLIAAYAARAEGERQAVADYVGDLAARDPALPFASRLREPADTASAGKPWALRLSTALGYNDNVIALGEGVPLPRDISDDDALLGRFALAASYDPLRAPGDWVRLGYALNATVHESDLDRADLLMNDLYAVWQHRWAPRWTSSLSASGQYVSIGGDSFRKRVGLRAAMSYRWSQAWRVEGYLRGAHENYDFTTTPVNDRDGENYHLGILGASRPQGLRPGLRLGWELGSWRTDGRNYDRHRNLLHATLDWRLPGATALRVAGSWARVDYAHRNSFAAFRARRDDTAWTLGGEISRPLPFAVGGRPARAWASVDYVDNDSNLRFFDYDQLALNLGVTLSF